MGSILGNEKTNFQHMHINKIIKAPTITNQTVKTNPLFIICINHVHISGLKCKMMSTFQTQCTYNSIYVFHQVGVLNKKHHN